MKNVFKLLQIILISIVFQQSIHAGTWTELNAPNSFGTYALGIEGDTVVGWYVDKVTYAHHGFIYNSNTQNWTTIDQPVATQTHVWNIQGNNVVGVSNTGGFVYNTITQNWTTFNHAVTGIDGSNLVGYFGNSPRLGFWGDGDDMHTISLSPMAKDTLIYDIDGAYIVGWYDPGDDPGHGFIYNIVSNMWIQIGYVVRGIDGNNVVGTYYTGNGYPTGERYNYIYNITTGILNIVENKPNSWSTELWSIDEDKIVGSFTDANGWHGFIYTIPEPMTISFFGIGFLVFRKK